MTEPTIELERPKTKKKEIFIHIHTQICFVMIIIVIIIKRKEILFAFENLLTSYTTYMGVECFIYLYF